MASLVTFPAREEVILCGGVIDTERELGLYALIERAFAEFIGTFWLVFGGCGSAVLAAAFPGLGIGFTGVALAFGLTVLTMVQNLIANAIKYRTDKPPEIQISASRREKTMHSRSAITASA
jgi:hypothetical protein